MDPERLSLTHRAVAVGAIYGPLVVSGAVAPRIVHRRYYRHTRELAVITALNAAAIYAIRFKAGPAMRRWSTRLEATKATLEEELGRPPTHEEVMAAVQEQQTHD